MDTTILRKVPLFASMRDSDLCSIAARLIEHHYPKNKVILLESDPGNFLFILVRGRVKITRSSKAGGEVILAILKEGDFFGEISLLDGKPRTASAIAMQDSYLLLLHREDFKILIREHPEISLNVMQELAARLRSSDTQIQSLSLLKTTGRVAATLLQLSETALHIGRQAVEIRKLPTHQELAGLAGTTRESVSRTLHEFEKDGFISRTQGHLIITDQQKFSRRYL